MPKSKHDLTNFGLWPSCDLPRTTVYTLLKHLNEPGAHLVPRLYVEQRSDGVLKASLSNSDRSIGRQTRVDITWVIRNGWVEQDPKLLQSNGLHRVYRLSNRGREAIAQYEARDYIFRLLLRKEIPAALRRFRKKAGLKDPAHT